MSGATNLNKVQLATEVTPGTPIAATTILRTSKMRGEDVSDPIFAEEEIGFIAGSDRSYIPALEYKIHQPSSVATFEQIDYILGSGVDYQAGVKDGPGTDYIRTYDFPTTADKSIKTRTLELGNNQEVEQYAYCFVESFTLEGKVKEALMVSAEWVAQSMIPGFTWTPGLSLPTVEDILFQNGCLYIDDVTGSFGVTKKSNTLLGMSMKVVTGWQARWDADCGLTFSRINGGTPVITLDITFEHDGTATAEKANRRNQVPRLLQIYINGNAAGTPGTTYTKKALILNLAGKWQKFSTIDDDNGNSTVTGSFVSRYNGTAAKFAQIISVNELAALP